MPKNEVSNNLAWHLYGISVNRDHALEKKCSNELDYGLSRDLDTRLIMPLRRSLIWSLNKDLRTELETHVKE